jgi:TolB-like protein
MGTDVQAGAASPSEIRDALARATASDELRASPQLVAFLTFVVNAELRGEGRRIKGYTIGIEALGRRQDFDPLTDSIVRVVAGRLRRALERYYAREGVDRSVIIELPRGRYVPLFRKGAAATQASAAAPDAEAGTADAPAAASQETPSGLGEATGPRNPAPAEIAPHGIKSLGFRSILLACLALAAIGLTLFKMREAGPNIGTPPAASPGPVAERTPPVAPAIFVDAFSATGQPQGAAFAPDALRRKVADAMARFDGIVIAEAPTAGAKPLSWSEYRFAGSLEYHEDGTTTLGFRLIDMSDGTVVWSRTFPRLHVEGDAGALEEAILREVVPAVAQPFGIVWTRELASHRVTDARRACILDAIEYWRSFNPARHEVVRQCLERLAAQEPRYAPVYSGLALAICATSSSTSHTKARCRRSTARCNSPSARCSSGPTARGRMICCPRSGSRAARSTLASAR